MATPTDPFSRVLGDFERQATQVTSCGRDPEEVETVEMLCDSIRRFGARRIDSASIDAEAHIPPDVLDELGEMGLFGLTIPEQYGGAGLSMKGTCRVIACLGSVDSSVGVTVGLHGGLGMRGLVHYGSDTLKQRYLPELARGKLIACFPITESEAGSDIASVRTTAVEDGDSMVVNGSKIYSTNGGFAHLATTVVRTPGLAGSRRGHSLLVIPLDSSGVHRDAEEHKLGIRGSSTCSIHFEDVRVDKDHILGEPSRGLDQLGHVLSWGRTLMAAGCIGLSRVAMNRTLEQVTTRRQFNRVIGEFGMVREMLAGMRSRLHAMECVIRLATQLEDEQAGSIAWESSAVKVYCTESAWRVCDDTLELHGGSGYIEDTGVARLLRDCRITRIFEGTNELMRFHMASACYTWIRKTTPPFPALAPMLDPALREDGQVFDDGLARLRDALQRQKKKHGLRVFNRQMDQRRVADASTSLYVMLALLARAQGEMRAGRAGDDLLCWTRLGIHALRRRCLQRLEELDANADELSSRIAAAECARCGCTLEETSG